MSEEMKKLCMVCATLIICVFLIGNCEGKRYDNHYWQGCPQQEQE